MDHNTSDTLKIDDKDYITFICRNRKNIDLYNGGTMRSMNVFKLIENF